MFVVTTDPFAEFLATFVFGNFNTKVHAAKTYAASNQFLEQLQPVLLNRRMCTAPV